MFARNTTALLTILIFALLLPGCSPAAAADLSGTDPFPTADIDATVQAVLQATAGSEAVDFAVKTPQPTAELSQPVTPEPTRTPSPTPSLTPTRVALEYELPVNVGPFVFPEAVNPLTGLTVEDPALLDRRPLAIKITNFPRRVRPQSGITLADQVFEYYIESGLTRFIAVFYGTDVDRVGPVRSGRFFDEHIVRMYNAVFAFASADRRVLETWLETDLVPRLVLPRPDNCPPLCRDESNPDYNNLYANTAQLGPYAVANGSDNNRYDLGGMRFQTLAPWGGEPAPDLFVRYSRLDYSNWTFNADTGLYERSQDKADDTGQGEQYAPLLDSYTGEVVSAANVIVLFVPHEEFVKSSDTEVVKIGLEGAGLGYAFRDGQVYEITWARPNVNGPLQIFRGGRGAGTHFPLKPGNTFFQVVGITTEVIQGDPAWRFNFAIP